VADPWPAITPPPRLAVSEQAPAPSAPRIASTAPPVREPVVPGPATSDAAGETFVPWTPRRLGTVDVLDALPDYRASSQVAAALVEIVGAEGPIHTDRLAFLVARGFGLNRVAETRKAAILRHLPRRLRNDPSESVVWPLERDPQEWTGFRRTFEGVDRPVEHVPLREVLNAMVASTRAAAGMPVEELHREVLAVFGGRRLTKRIAARLDAALALGVRSDRLAVEQGDRAGAVG
jgi:hypothetical protein